MHSLFYSVTATFTTLVFALILFVSEQFSSSTPSELYNAPQTRAHAIRLLETLRKDVQHLHLAQDLADESPFSCRVQVDTDGRTHSFTFPTVRMSGPDEEAKIVQVTYELEGTGTQVETRTGTRDLFKLNRILENGVPRSIPMQSSTQIVDFVIELIPSPVDTERTERIISGDCPSDLEQVYVEFHVAIQETSKHINISRYSSTFRRNPVNHQMNVY